MNKVYKVIWSKAKNCYVVASELAKSRTKSPRSVKGRTLVAMVMACLLGFSVSSAYAETSTETSHKSGGSTTVSYVDGYWIWGNNTTVTNDRNGTGVGVTEADGFIGIGNGISAIPRTGRDGRYASYMLDGLTALPVISHSVAVGDGVTLREEETIGIGYNALSEGYKSISIGSGAISNYERNVTIGAGAHSHGHLATALGAEAKAYGYRTVAIGYDAQALPYDNTPAYGDAARSRAVAIGSGSRALANLSVAIGDNAIAEAGKAWVVSIGANSYSGLLGANANGYGARAFGKNSVAMGRQARAGEPASPLPMNDATTYVKSKGDMNGFGAVAIGYLANAAANSSFAVGYKAQAFGEGSMAFGSGAPQTDGDFDNITKAWGKNSIAFGYNARALADNTVSLGAYSEATGQRSMVFGTSGMDAVASGMGLLDNSRAEGQGSIAIGDRAVVDSKILVQSTDPDVMVNDAVAVGTEAHTRARNGIAIGGNVSYTNDKGVTTYGSHNGRDFGALVGEGADSAIAIGGASLDVANSKLDDNKLVVSYEAAASFGKRGVAIGSGALVSGGSAYDRYESLIDSDDYKNAKLAFETAETEYLNAQLQVSNKQTEIDNLDPSADDYETVKAQLESELATLTTTAGEKLNALEASRPAWEEQEAAALSLQQGNAEADADAIAIGTNSRAGIKNSIAVGKDASTGDKAESSIAIGENAQTGETALRSIAIGKGSVVNGSDSIALGKSTVEGDKSIAIGYGHTVNGNNSGTFGDPNIVNADNSYVVGNNSKVEENMSNAFVFGNNVTVNNGTLPADWNTFTDEVKSDNTGYGVVALGNNVTVSLDEKAYKSRESGTAIINHVVAIGDNSVVGEENATAIGYGAQSKALNSLAIGTGATAQAENSISIGGSANTAEKNALAIGNASTALKEGSLSFGSSASSSEKNAMALGNQTTASAEGGVAIGFESKASRTKLNGTSVYGYDVTRNGDRAGTDKTSSVWQSTMGAVSIGTSEDNARTSATGTRQLIGLAAGTADTDAVNVAQLKQAATHYYSVNADDSVNPNDTNFLNDGAKSVGAMAVGPGAFGYGDYSVAVGYGATAGATDGKGFTGHYSVAIGNGASAVDLNSVAIGSGAVAEKENSVSIGSGSVATEVNSVSFGTAAVMSGETVVTPEVTRRLMHVTAGTDDTDAVNVKQLRDMALDKANVDASNVGKSITLSDDYFAPGTTDEEKATATREARLLNQRVWGEALGGLLDTQDKTHVAASDTRLVQGKDVHQHVTPGSDGNYIAVASTTGQNLTALDEALKASDDSSVKSITASGRTVTYTKGDGSTGTFQTQDTTYTAGHGLTLTETEFKAKAGTNITVNADGINAIGNGVVESGNTGLISGGTLFSEGRVSADGNYVMAVNTVAGNLSALDTALKASDDTSVKSITANGKVITYTKGNGITGTFETQDTTYTAGNGLTLTGTEFTAKAGTNVTVNGDGINVLGNGVVESGNTGLINGGTLFSEGRVSANGNYVTAANTIAGNLSAMDTALKTSDNTSVKSMSASGKTVTYVKGDGSTGTFETQDTTYTAGNGLNLTGTEFTAKAGTNVTVNSDGINAYDTKVQAGAGMALEANGDTADTNNVRTYKVGLSTETQNKLDNAMASFKTAVDGGTAQTISKTADTANFINGKNMEMTAGEAGITVATKENVSFTSVTAGTGDSAVVINGSGVQVGGATYISGSGLNANSKVISNVAAGSAATDAVNVSQLEELGEGKANVTLNNITDAGHTVIKTDAKSVINVTGGNYATVAKTDVNGVDTYTVNVATDGAVVQNDTKLVTGGTVYVALKDGLDTKANTTLNNITEEGETVIKNLAKGAVKVVNGTNTTVTEGTDGDAKTYAINAKTDGVVASGNTGIVTGGTVYGETRPAADGNYIATANTAGANLTALDTQVKQNADDIATLGDGKANIALDNITNAGHNVIKTDAKSAINVTGGTYATVAKTDVDGVDTYTVNVATDGAVADGDTKLVTGGTVYNAIQNLQTDVNDALDGKANISLNNINTDGQTVVKNLAKTAINVVGNADITSTKTDVNGVDTYNLAVVKDGAVADGNTKIVTGGTVYNALKTMQDTVDDALDGKANVALDNVTEAGHGVIKTDAKSAINVTGGNYATVAKTDVNGVDTYTVNVATDGAIAEGDTKLVTGGTVYNSIKDLVVSVDGKANVSLNNITEAGHGVIKADAKSAINVTGGTYATVVKTDVNGVDTYTVNVANDGTIASGDTKLVTGDTVYQVIQDMQTNVDNDLTGKANVSLNNINADGTNVVRNIAKNAVKVADGENTTVSSETDTDGNITYKVKANATGAVADNDTGLVDGGTVYSAIQEETRPASDGNYISASDTAGANLTALDTQMKTNSEDITNLKNLSNITNDGKTVIKNLAKGSVNVVGNDDIISTKTDVNGVDTYNLAVVKNGAVASGDTKLVTGDTVHNAIQNLQTNVNDALDGKANVSLNNVTEAGHGVIKADAKSAINVVGGNYATVAKTDVSGVDTYTVNVATDGAVAAHDTKLVTGDTVFNAIATATDNILDSVYTELGNKANVDASNVGKNATTDNSAKWGEALGTGAVASDDGKLVTGKTVYNEVRPATNGNYVTTANTTGANLLALDAQTKTNTDDVTNLKNLSNITNDGKTVIKNLAKGSVNVVGNDDITVTKTDVSGVDTYNLAVVKDGAVADGNTKIVTGGTVYNAIQNVVNNTQTALDGKANIALDNITEAGHNVIKADAQSAIKVEGKGNIWVDKNTNEHGVNIYTVNVDSGGSVAAGEVGLITGKTAYDALMKETRPENGNYIKLEDSAGKNLNALDSQIKTNADAIAVHATDITNLKDLSNITEAGTTVIKNLAKESVNVVGGSYATVVKTDVNGVDTYTVNVATDGAVAEGDTKLVTGGTVYNAMKDLTVSVDGKANVSLDNITADGHNVIKTDAKSAINVKGNNDVKVTKTDVDGVDTYNLSVAKDGTVVGGDTKLVTGDTVYNAIQGVISDTETALNGKANVNLDNINADGVNVVRTIAKNAVKVADGENTTVSSETDTDGNITYKVKTNATGTITANNTGLLNGGTVYNEVRPASDGNYITVANTTGQNLTALDAKLKQTYELAIEASTQGHDANAVHYDSASKEKVTLQGENGTVLTNLKDGEVSATSTDAVTGKQLHEVKQTTVENKQAIENLTEKVGTTNDGSYVKNINTVGQNLNALDSQVKNNSDAINTLRTDTNNALETKTNTDMSNLTDTGRETIRELARGSVNVVSEDGTVKVTESDVDAVRTFDLSVVKDGKVESGNTGIVTGDTVYKAIQNAEVSDEHIMEVVKPTLETFADKDLSNITDKGTKVIREAVRPELEQKANVDASNINVEKWTDKLGVGEVKENDAGLVRGGAVYDAIQKSSMITVEDNAIRIGAKNDAEFIDITNSNGEGRVLHGVITDPNDKNSAANVGYVNAIGEAVIDGVNGGFRRMDEKINKTGAHAAALASLTPASFDGDERWAMAASVGNYHGETAAAIGAFYRPADNVMINLRSSLGSGNNMVGAGVSFALDKGFSTGVSKKQMLNTINAQAEKLQQAEAKIAELEAIVKELVKERKQ